MAEELVKVPINQVNELLRQNEQMKKDLADIAYFGRKLYEITGPDGFSEMGMIKAIGNIGKIKNVMQNDTRIKEIATKENIDRFIQSYEDQA